MTSFVQAPEFHADPEPIYHFFFPPTGKGPQGCMRSELITEDPRFGQVALVSVHSGTAEACCVPGTGDIEGNQTG